MINRNTPRISGALPSALSIKVYSDDKELSMQDRFLLDYALSNPEGIREPKEPKPTTPIETFCSKTICKNDIAYRQPNFS